MNKPIEMTADHSRVSEILQEISDNDLWDDMYEHDQLALAEKFPELPAYDVRLLHQVLQGESNQDCTWDIQDVGKFRLAMDEAIHQGLEGWSKSDKIVIHAFLSDIALAASQS